MPRSRIPVQLFCWILLVGFFSAATQGQVDSGPFAEPELILQGEKPLNHDGGMMYPSPAVFDIDSDGQDELVIGTIFGALFSCENENRGEGAPVWGPPVGVKSADGKLLKLNNW